jgi:hypothetical protein
MVKGSLATFINAMTFPDKTVYPAASTNLQDFYNLLDVYADAVFHPLMTPEKLAQEGWHYELDAADGPLTFKGVVFNEMKGAYSSPDNLLDRYQPAAPSSPTTPTAWIQRRRPGGHPRPDLRAVPRVLPDLLPSRPTRCSSSTVTTTRRSGCGGWTPTWPRSSGRRWTAPWPLQPPFDAPRQVRHPYERQRRRRTGPRRGPSSRSTGCCRSTTTRR